ncbi:MAG: hypothetical protein HeimC2_41510 [Candidatus Heimdallarchaeota archaeon LC_2]|nr:MAG: hypothetical protein HeimC2_41510 [Candidatus Heimdallarchaeota archaeon LC_2]
MKSISTKESKTPTTNKKQASLPIILELQGLTEETKRKAAKRACQWMDQLSDEEKNTMQNGTWAEYFTMTIIELELLKYFPKYTLSKSSDYSSKFELLKRSKKMYTIEWIKNNGRDIDLYDHNSNSMYQIEVKSNMYKSSGVKISSAQFRNMQVIKKKYFLYNVTSTHSLDADISSMRNPAAKLNSQMMKIRYIWADI